MTTDDPYGGESDDDPRHAQTHIYWFPWLNRNERQKLVSLCGRRFDNACHDGAWLVGLLLDIEDRLVFDSKEPSHSNFPFVRPSECLVTYVEVAL